jgi:hypothetical protein
MKGHFQFSLRQFLIATTALGVLLAWIVSIWTCYLTFDPYSVRGAALENRVLGLTMALVFCALGWWVTETIVAHVKALF